MAYLTYSDARYWLLSELRRLRSELRRDNKMRNALLRQLVLDKMVQLRRVHRVHPNMRVSSDAMRLRG